MDKVSSSIKKISVDGVPIDNASSSAISRNPSSVFAVVQHEPTIIRGESGHPILSGVEHNYVNKSWNRPSNMQTYMRRYVEALRAQSRKGFHRGQI
jgi:hypothetical protein